MEGTKKPPVNDGGGFLDSVGAIDSLIVDCNELPKRLFSGNYVSFCNLIVQMVQKLSLVRDGIVNDHNDLEERIADKKRLCDELLAQLNEGGANDGCAQDNP